MNQKTYDESLAAHRQWRGKIETLPRVDVDSDEALALCYTPGVAKPCLEIQRDYSLSWELTRRWNTVAVITDGTAILGLGDIGPEAGIPVMEGKAALFKAFGGVDAFPICIRSKDPEEIIRTIYLISGSFGGINLEDISSPRCFQIEERLKKICDVPVFHDDQHGTAIVTAAAVINACKVAHKDIHRCKVVMSGAGAAATAVGKFLLYLGVDDIIFSDIDGIIYEGKEGLSEHSRELAKISNKERRKGVLADAFPHADIFVGLSAGGIVSKTMISSMNPNPICFPLANPVPEISPEECLEAGASVIGTGSSKYPNQINNVLVFPGVFRGALDARSRDIDEAMMLAASKAIASSIPESELSPTNIIPKAFDSSVHRNVAKAVYEAAYQSGLARAKHE